MARRICMRALRDSSDRWGNRRVVILAQALFVVATASAGLACSGAPGATPDSGVPSDGGVEGGSHAHPYLESLSVASADYPALTLVPGFSPNVYDYYVRCSTGANALTVAMAASPGAASALSLPMTSPAAPQQTVQVTAQENQAIVATATAGNVTTEYWVRCLPTDFPPIQMILHPEAGTPPAGYYLLGNSAASGTWGYAMVLNGYGVPVWYLRKLSGDAVNNVDTFARDVVSLFSTTSSKTSSTTRVEQAQLDPWKTTRAAPSDNELDSHELRVLGNGHYLAISAPTKSGVDLTGVRVPNWTGGIDTLGSDETILDCNILEFEPSGKVVWKWVGSEHFSPARDTTEPLYQAEPGGVPVVDTFHCNSIDVDPANGDLLVSARNMDSVFYIDRATGVVLWKMGGSNETVDHAIYVPLDDRFFRQHDARLLPGWSQACGTGQISMFDDHSQVKGPARGLVLDVALGGHDGGGVGGEGGAGGDAGDSGARAGGDAGKGIDCGPDAGGGPRASVAWEYDGMTNSESRGSFRILPDGSRVIGWGASGTHDLVFTEVDFDKHDLADFSFLNGQVSYRAVKVPLSAFDLQVLRTAAGRTDP